MEKKFKKLFLVSTITSFFPVVAFADFSLGAGTDSTFGAFIGYIIGFISLLIPVLFALAFIVFFWGLSKFILNSDGEKEIQNGKTYMFWGILALFILISFRAIISFVSADLELGDSRVAPQLPGGSSITP